MDQMDGSLSITMSARERKIVAKVDTRRSGSRNICKFQCSAAVVTFGGTRASKKII